MKTIILNQRKERDELMSRPYLIRKSIQDTDFDNRSSTGGQIYSGIIDAT